MNAIEKLARKSKAASRLMAQVPDAVKKSALRAAGEALVSRQNEILNANSRDVAFAKKEKLSAALIDRLTLNDKRIMAMRDAVFEIADSKDPIGEIVEELSGQNGLRIQKVRVPLGVIAMIYESRPNVTVESAALCLKAGNSVILRGGREAIHSNTILWKTMVWALSLHGIPKDAVILITQPDRKNIYELSRLDSWIDLMIARGSEKMVRDIKASATVPVLGHGKGVCHVYVDKDADLDMAENIAFNAKVQRPGVCNAAESLLVHRDAAVAFLPRIAARFQAAGVVLHGDPQAKKLIPWAKKSTEKNWSTEYLNLEMSVKVVDSLDAAIQHINRYGSGHTDTIVTRDRSAAQTFLKSVDSAAVFANASTRMHDGGVFGLGAEIGISTQKLHARGTMGVRELTATKYVAEGSGQVRP